MNRKQSHIQKRKWFHFIVIICPIDSISIENVTSNTHILTDFSFKITFSFTSNSQIKLFQPQFLHPNFHHTFSHHQSQRRTANRAIRIHFRAPKKPKQKTTRNNKVSRNNFRKRVPNETGSWKLAFPGAVIFRPGIYGAECHWLRMILHAAHDRY